MDLDIKNLPEEVTIKTYLGLSLEYGWINISEYDDLESYITISGPVEVTYKLSTPDDAINQAISNLKEEISKVRAVAELKCNEIEGKIQNLLALPNKSEEGE